MNKVFITIAQLSWGRTVLTGMGAFALYYFLMYNDGSTLKQNLESSTNELTEVQRQLQATRDAVANADRFEKEVKSIVDQFGRVTDFMPEKISVAEMTAMVSDIAARVGTKLIKTEPREGTDKSDFYDTTRLAFTLEGSFSEIVMFLSQISRVPKLMTFDEVVLTTQQGSNLESPTISFNGVLVGYRYIIHEEKKDAAAPAAGAGTEGAANGGK